MKAKNVMLLGLVIAVAGGTGYLCLRPPASRSHRPVPVGAVTNGQQSDQSVSVGHPAISGTITTAPSLSTLPQDSEISENVRAIVDLQGDYFKRLASVQALKSAPTPTDSQTLYGFLLKRNEWDDRQQGQVLKNDLMDVLCAQVPPPPGLCDMIVLIYRDSEQHIVLRDYAVQHLVSYYEKLGQASSASVWSSQRAEEETIREVLHEALKEVDSSIAGTALLGLSLLAQDHPDFDRQQIAAAALELASEGAAGELTRITALQVCGRLGLKEALPVVSHVAKEGETIALRIAAVAALGVLGGIEVKPFLQDLLNGAEERLKLPARQALKRIQQQEAQPAIVGVKG